MNEVAELPKPGWQAELELKIGVRPHFGDGVSRLVARRHRGPLVIQRPFYPEGDPCHLYVVHPPGGVVGGDELRIDVEVERGAHAVITTPAATKFYRCDGRTSSQTQELNAADATLEWLPQESIFYRGADTRTATRVHLDAESRFIGWEIACLGLPARGERFDVGALKLDLEVWKATATPLFIDRLRLTGGSPARGARWGLAGQEAVGTLLATPATREHIDAIRDLVADLPLAAVSLVDGILVLRALAPQAEAVRNLFVDAWKRLRPGVIGRVAVAPRIWST
jgi:urease accessory protein